MRLIFSAASLIALAATPAFAAPESVDANCALYSECTVPDAAADATETVTEAAPVPANPRVRTSKTRGFSMSGPAVAAPAPKAAAASAPRAAPKAKVAMVSKPKTVQAMQAQQAVKAAQLMTFFSGSDKLTPEGTIVAQQLAIAMLRADKRAQRFSVQGHTDAVGARAYNLALSERRAKALAEFFAAQGIDRSRFETVGFGFDKPLAGVAATNAANRRVEVKPIS